MNQKIEDTTKAAIDSRRCRLCGKDYPISEFRTIVLAKLANVAVKYDGCEACEKVIKNATIIIKETVENFLKSKPKIIRSGQG